MSIGLQGTWLVRLEGWQVVFPFSKGIEKREQPAYTYQVITCTMTTELEEKQLGGQGLS